MASTITKRQQARNERALQEMTKTIPGNDRCADCATKNPSWASWNLGIFLCMRCAALHRKLGTHISKVKSLSMDTWSVEQVENMRKMGNVNSNRTRNPQNAVAQIPVDADEADAAIEKFIRQKYEQQAFVSGSRSTPTTRHNTGSTGTDSHGDDPPPLPPKPNKYWGFNLRSSSSSLPKTKKDYDTPISSTITVAENRSKGKLFGMKVTSVGNNFDQKLNMLQEMGFTDTKKNQDILKHVDGSLDRAIEILTRLGGNDRVDAEVPPETRATTPALRVAPSGTGLRLTKTRQRDADDSPWEIKEPQRSATAPVPKVPALSRSQSTEPMNNTWNPFLQSDPAQAVAGAFQNLRLSQPQQQVYQPPFAPQPLSVQTTGNPWGVYLQPQHAMSVPAIPMQSSSQMSPLQPQHSNNPFFHTASPQSITSSNPWSRQMTPQTGTPVTPHSNPFGIPWQEVKQSTNEQHNIVQSQQHMPYSMTPQGQMLQQESTPQQYASPPTQYFSNTPQYTSSPQPQQFATTQQGFPFSSSQQDQVFAPSSQSNLPPSSPFQMQSGQHVYNSTTPQSQTESQGYASTAPQNQYVPQGYNHITPQSRHDKSSIMALYNQPQRQLQTLPEDSVSPSHDQRQAFVPSNTNPFAQQQNSITSHVSKESMDFQAFNREGRHSPDAFAGLSSRYMR